MYPPGIESYQVELASNVVSSTKGTDLMNIMLLDQYTNSPKLLEYMSAYVGEMDFLLEQIETVYIGRFIEYAVGEQLDGIGRILKEARSIDLGTRRYFGFQGASGLIGGFADEATPTVGGFLKSVDEDFAVTPLDDFEYRNLLMAKALVINADVANLQLTYDCIKTLLGRVPVVLGVTVTGTKQVTINLSAVDVSDIDEAFIRYFLKYLAPTGAIVDIVRT